MVKYFKKQDSEVQNLENLLETLDRIPLSKWLIRFWKTTPPQDTFLTDDIYLWTSIPRTVYEVSIKYGYKFDRVGSHEGINCELLVKDKINGNATIARWEKKRIYQVKKIIDVGSNGWEKKYSIEHRVNNDEDCKKLFSFCEKKIKQKDIKRWKEWIDRGISGKY